MSVAKSFLGRVVRILENYGVKHVILSPGSRNAPLVLAFAGYPGIRILTVPDERSAGYFALGIAQQTGKPVILVCTSGTAPLNYSPAVAEAYYQKIPLLIFTADRPPDRIDQGDGQAIRQNGIYNNFIRQSFIFPEVIASKSDEEETERMFHKAYQSTLYPQPGPVHVNFPFTEPLYDFIPDYQSPVSVENFDGEFPKLSVQDENQILSAWRHTDKKLILAGQMLPGHGLDDLLVSIDKDPSVVILTETTSNIIAHDSFITGIDTVIDTVLPEEYGDFAPDLVITFGGHIVSRKIKSTLEKMKPAEHWHVNPAGEGMNIFGCLTRTITARPQEFFKLLSGNPDFGNNTFHNKWISRAHRSEERMKHFLAAAPFSDLKVYERIFASLPPKSILHLGNSTPVRYHQLFVKKDNTISVFGNRGVSGIDGTVSTAAGAAYMSGDPLYLVTGDMGFFYDSNGLWHKHLKDNLKIIVVNNGGGGIFRFIDGPEQSGYLELFESPHDLSAKPLAELFGLRYFSADDEVTLDTVLSTFHGLPGPSVLEVFTPRETNGIVLKSYFSELKRK